MSTWAWLGVALGAWVGIAVPVGVLLGKGIRLADEAQHPDCRDRS